MHYGIVDNGSSVWIANLLKELFLKYDLQNYPKQITIVSDGGSENKGDVITWLESLNSPLISKQTAKTKEFIYTNNEIESTFNIFKNEFLGNKEITDKEHAKKLLAASQLYNDNERYPLMLYGLTPQEVFDGAIIDKNRFKENIQQATKTRYLKNKEGKFCNLCSEK